MLLDSWKTPCMGKKDQENYGISISKKNYLIITHALSHIPLQTRDSRCDSTGSLYSKRPLDTLTIDVHILKSSVLGILP